VSGKPARWINLPPAAAILCVTLIGAMVPSAAAHIVNPDGSTTNIHGITHNHYHSAFTPICVYTNGSCSVHSFTFTSANDYSGTNGTWLAMIWSTAYPPSDGNVVRQAGASGAGIARICLTNAHSGASGALHCVDQDSTQYKAGSYNYSPSTTITRHPVY
jgi:hypothetical protein